jgi:Rne/Rng family ribonuclease
MNKELFVSATPHETKVGITEDDQLAEIYLERENEYTLAGSIYKGRVTRVLPGMQSAFVDIGLERDAFLYVSDFMDLEQQDEDLDEAIPANRPVMESRPRPVSEGDAAVGQPFENDATGPEVSANTTPGNGAGARDFRGRRRRRGRRGEIGRGERPEIKTEPGEMPTESTTAGLTEAPIAPPRTDSRNDRFGRGDRPGRSGSDSRFQRPAAPARVGRDYDYGPPPGYQPIILPGESISKYQRQNQSESASAQEVPTSVAENDFADQEMPTSTAAPIIAVFPEDEPIFAAAPGEPLRQRHQEHDDASAAEGETEFESQSRGPDTVLAVVPELAPEISEEGHKARTIAKLYTKSETVAEMAPEGVSIEAPQIADDRPNDFPTAMAHPAMEEQEIEEEEADLTSYGEEPGDDDGFEELEEETQAAGGELSRSKVGDAAAALVASGEVVANGEALPEAVLEAEEREAEELALEEAQAEAEALLEAEAIGEGTVDASAEVRGPAPEARLLQRTQRRGPERGFDRGRGRRGGGGRRFRSRENTVVPQISELLKEGQEVLIQIAKEPIGKKGARITSHIALPGRFLVFMPTVNHTGVSRKISSEEERQRLKRIIQSERENGGGGFIVRTAAAGASDEELRADIRFLKNLWNEIKSRSDSSKSPALIYHDLNVVERVLRDQVSSEFSAIWVDTEQEYERILRFANRFQPGLVKRVKLYTKETPLYDQFGLNEEINKALKSKVWLKSGGYIVINQTEALVAIDVNTGKYVGKTARLEDTIVKTNVDAIKEIVRQVRLRDLGGIIIIDFIDMDERRNRQKVMQALEEALRLDRAPSKVLQFNDFGLVAITRKRVKQSLERTIGSPCPYCQATGFVKAVNTICNEVYVEMRKISTHLEHSDVMLRVNPEVAKALKANNAKLLTEMEELTKKTIIVKSDPALHQEQFDIH